jgi:hypothetical protein
LRERNLGEKKAPEDVTEISVRHATPLLFREVSYLGSVRQGLWTGLCSASSLSFSPLLCVSYPKLENFNTVTAKVKRFTGVFLTHETLQSIPPKL